MSHYDDVLFSNGSAFHLANVPVPRLTYGAEVDPGSELASFIIQKAVALTASKESRCSEKRTDPFPLVQPSSFRRSVLGDILTPGAYCCSLKTDGVRSLLLLTQCEEGPLAVLIDRRMKISRLEIWGDTEFFNDSLFDGEVVVEESASVKRRDVFLVFDVYACKGASQLLSDYSDRVRIYTEAILPCDTRRDDAADMETTLAETGKLASPPSSCLTIRAKPVAMDARLATEVWGRRLVTPHMNDGLVFTPNTIVLTKKPVFKWKTVHTVDILFDASSESVYSASQGCIVPIEAMRVCAQKFSTFTFRSNALSDAAFRDAKRREAAAEAGCIFECTIDLSYDAEEVTFTPIKERRDKTIPNSLYVTKETIANVIENVIIDEFASSTTNPSSSKQAKRSKRR